MKPWFRSLSYTLALMIVLQSGAVGGLVSQAAAQVEDPAAAEGFEEDPWEPFNEKMFAFNRQVDRFVLKPIATGWDFVLPDVVQTSIANAVRNLFVVPRLVNNILQLKFAGAGREVTRFTINSTVGIAGLFDVAGNSAGIKESDEDFGQTLGVWGVGPGPYLVLPFLPVTTVRDGIGGLVDTAMNPFVWLVPTASSLGTYATDGVNQRSRNLDKFERVEETVVDLYGAVRNAYLQRRAAAIKE